MNSPHALFGKKVNKEKRERNIAIFYKKPQVLIGGIGSLHDQVITRIFLNPTVQFILSLIL